MHLAILGGYSALEWSLEVKFWSLTHFKLSKYNNLNYDHLSWCPITKYTNDTFNTIFHHVFDKEK
jgi:hypothetical protein